MMQMSKMNRRSVLRGMMRGGAVTNGETLLRFIAVARWRASGLMRRS